MFKFLIEGKTIAELKANISQFFEEFPELQPSGATEDRQDFLTKTAAVQPIPIASTPTAVPPTPGVSVPNDYGVDSRGLPWDERIHSTTQGKNKDGSWRYKRGVEDHQIKSVEGDLAVTARRLQAEALAPQPTAAPPVSLPSPIPVVQSPAPVLPPLPPPPAQLPNAHTVETFKKTLIPTLAKLVTEGKLTKEYVKSLCEHYEVEEIYKVSDAQAEEMFNQFVQYGLIQKA